jgi:hypothetical protein
MYIPYQLMKARRDDMLHAAAQHRLAAQARHAHNTRRLRTLAAPARRRAALRLRKLFS